MQVQVHVINPLALSNNELYGSFDEGTHEWQDGVLARIMRTVCKDESPDQKWILFDGPVDTLWIESMNTLLDDNKLLTLLSGERISMSPQVLLSPCTIICCLCSSALLLGLQPLCMDIRRVHGRGVHTILCLTLLACWMRSSCLCATASELSRHADFECFQIF